MDDREVVTRMRQALDELTADIGDAPPLDRARHRGAPPTRHGSNRRAPILLAVAAVVAVTVGLAVIAARSPDDRPQGTADATAAPTSTVAPTSTTGQPIAAVEAADIEGITWASPDPTDPAPRGRFAQVPIRWFELGPDGSIRGWDGCRAIGGDPGTATVVAGTLQLGELTHGESLCDTAPASPFDGSTIALDRTDDGRLRLTSDGASLVAEPLDDDRVATPDEILGVWTDGTNTYEFEAGGVLRFSRLERCDGGYVLSEGRLDVSFGTCGTSSVELSAPIFRAAIAYRSDAPGVVLLAGDAGVFALERVA
jgi:hypothetical protein